MNYLQCARLSFASLAWCRLIQQSSRLWHVTLGPGSANSAVKRSMRSSFRIAAKRCPTAPFIPLLRMRARLEWVARGGHAAPRLHDLRHTFICHALLRSYQQPQPINNVIDAISTYVGHAKVSDTYWYVTATPELMAVAAQRFSQFAERGTR